MPATCKILITLRPGGPHVDVPTVPIRVPSKGRVHVIVSGANQFPHTDYPHDFLGVEIHMPGNHKRRVMHGMFGLKHVFFFDGRGGDIRIGGGLTSGETHEFRVYAHFSGSVTTVPASSSPSMIIQ
jgi:hypothetical protein